MTRHAQRRDSDCSKLSHVFQPISSCLVRSASALLPLACSPYFSVTMGNMVITPVRHVDVALEMSKCLARMITTMWHQRIAMVEVVTRSGPSRDTVYSIKLSSSTSTVPLGSKIWMHQDSNIDPWVTCS